MSSSSCSCNETVGFRFHPTDKELIDHYLLNKAAGHDSAVRAIGEVVGNLYDREPQDLPRFSGRGSNDQVWYLFCRRNRSQRVKRTTKLGYWKLTGKHRAIKATVGIGTKKTLVFYKGRGPKAQRTPWVIHEYTLPDNLPNQKGFFLCKLKKKFDEEANISTKECQPSNNGDDKISDNSTEINVDELLAQLIESDSSNKAEDEVASALNPHMYAEQSSSPNAATFLDDTSGDFDGVRNHSNTNEQDDGAYLVSSTMQSQMHEEHLPSFNDTTFICEFQNDSSTKEEDDEFWNHIFVDDDSYPDERSNQLI